MSNERKQAFVDLVKQYPVLLSRSQLPHIKEQKALALSSLVDEFKEQLGIKFNRLNLQKKILNLKRQITKKATEQKDIITMKPYEQDFLQHMIAHGVKCELSDTDIPINDFASTAPKSSAKKRRYESSSDDSEDEETRTLSTDKLHRKVLIQQLKLIKMQMAQIVAQNNATQ